MIRISNLSLPVDGDLEQLRKRAARALGLRPGQLGELEIVRQSIDARNRSEVHYVYTVELSMPQEERLVENAPGRNVSRTERQAYAFPAAGRRSALPPVVVGMGPAGLFAALFLARNGFPCVVLERGQDVDQRTADVERFWSAGALDAASNVQFGEGGAGTFSDGKLTTGTHDPRIAAVLDTLVEAGAPADVKYSHKPHIGTDVLRQVVKHIRQELIALGCDVRFGHRLDGLTIPGDALTGLPVEGPQGPLSTCPATPWCWPPATPPGTPLPCCHQAGVPMEQKPFAIGVRIEHLQRRSSPGPVRPGLETAARPRTISWPATCPPAAPPSPSACAPAGRWWPPPPPRDRLVTNGMSFRARDGKNINGGFLVGVAPEDFRRCRPLAGVRFQEEWERAAFQAGGGGFLAPAQRVEDFLKKRPSQGPGAIRPTYRPGVTWTELDRCLPGGGGGYAAGSPAPDGPEAPGLRRAGRGAHRSGDPLLLAGAHPAGRDLPVRPAGPVPLRRGGGLRRRDRLRRRGRHPGGRGRGPGIKNKTRCPAGSAFLLGGEKRPFIPADPYER